MYAHEEGERGRLIFGQAPQRFHLLHETVFSRQQRTFGGKVGLVPAQCVAEKPRDLIIEVVPRSQSGEPVIHGDFIEVVPLDFAADRADGTSDGGLDVRHGQTILCQDLGDERQFVPGAEIFHDTAGHG